MHRTDLWGLFAILAAGAAAAPFTGDPALGAIEPFSSDLNEIVASTSPATDDMVREQTANLPNICKTLPKNAGLQLGDMSEEELRVQALAALFCVTPDNKYWFLLHCTNGLPGADAGDANIPPIPGPTPLKCIHPSDTPPLTEFTCLPRLGALNLPMNWPWACKA